MNKEITCYGVQGSMGGEKNREGGSRAQEEQPPGAFLSGPRAMKQLPITFTNNNSNYDLSHSPMRQEVSQAREGLRSTLHTFQRSLRLTVSYLSNSWGLH